MKMLSYEMVMDIIDENDDYETMRKNAWDMAREFKSIAHWKWDNTNMNGYPYKCSVCGYNSDQCFPHCPSCGREMLI